MFIIFFEVRHKPSNNEDFIEDIVRIINGRYKGLSGKKLVKIRTTTTLKKKKVFFFLYSSALQGFFFFFK